MKKQLFILVALIIAATGLMAQTIITTPEELHNVRDDLSGDYILGNDIDLDPAIIGSETWYDAVLGWEPIGIGTSPFTGTFDGDGYTISNLTIDRPAEYYVGLLGYCSSDAIISDVTIAGADVEGYAAVGILVGELCGSMYNCSSSGAVVANQNGAGGLIGQVIARGTNEEVVGCYSDATVVGDISVGGLIGPISTHPGIGYRYTISNCGTTGNVTGNTEVAGFAARIYRTGIIQDCYASGDVTSSTGHGGFLAHIEIWDITTIENCYAIGDIGSVTSTQQPFIGDLYSGTPTISNCYYNQDINGVATNGLGIGRTTAEMTYPHAANTYETWDFTTPVWNEDPHYFINSGYPFLFGSGLQTIITTAEELHNIRYNTDASGNIIGDYILGNDIDLDPAGLGAWYDPVMGWEPIGGPPVLFQGTFDGNGYTINNLTLNRPGTDYLGLFGFCDEGSTLTHITILNANITGDDSHIAFGILCGDNHGNIDHCSTTGIVNGGQQYIGGLLGHCSAINEDITVSNCYSEASVNGGSVIGGLIGRLGSNNYTYRAYIVNSYATGDVSATTGSAGGLVGDFYRNGTIQNSYATGDITDGLQQGGLVGVLQYPDNHVIEKSYSTGSVGTVGGDIQPFIGSTSWGGTPTINNCYYNQDITGPATNGLGTGRTTSEMTYPYASNTYETWDFSTPVWVADPHYFINDGYPFLLESELQFVITTAEELHNVRDNLAVDYILGNDIDLDPVGLGAWYDMVLGWEPIGTAATPFTGTIDGNGYTIGNLTFNRPGEEYLGLFGSCGGDAVLTNMHIEDADVTGEDILGILAGALYGSAYNCSSSGIVTGNNHAIGGLIGGNEGTVDHCSTSGIVSGFQIVGGLIGWTNSGCISSSSDATVDADYAAGGLIGHLEGGSHNPSVIACFATGDVTGNISYAGGLIGEAYSKINMSNCYSSGNVGGATIQRGGLIGHVYYMYDNNTIIENCYSTCFVGTVDEDSQPLIGSPWYSNPIIINCYYNSDISGPATNVMGTGRTTEEMTYPYAVNTYETWDFSTPVWVEDWASKHNGYPWLEWQELHQVVPPEPNITLQDPYYTDCGEYAFDVTVQDFILVGALSLTLDYDPAVLEYVSVDIPDPDILSQSITNIPSPGTFKLAGYYQPDAITLPENEILLTLTFDVLDWGESTDLTWPDVPTAANEISGPNGKPVYIDSFFDITFDIPDELALSETHIGVSCFEGADGSIDLTVIGGEPSYTYAWSGPNSYTAASEDILDLEAGLYSVSVTDASGCIKTLVDIELIVLDSEAPVISTCPPDYGLEGCSTDDITGLTYSVSLVEVTDADFTTEGGEATDNCTITYYAYQDGSAGSCPITVTRTWTLKDGMDNTTTCVQTILIDDTTPPEITACASDVEVFMNEDCTATGVDLGTPVYSDNCDPAPVAGNNAVEPYPEGETTVTWTVTDACGNESTCLQTVTVHYNTLEGIMTYHDGGQALGGVILTLDDGVLPVTATTDVDGNYLFNDLCADSYTLSADFGSKAVGGINATDAAQANYWGVAPSEIEYIQFYAGDAVLNNYLDATDAGRILTWFVQVGDPPMSHPWKFWLPGDLIDENPLSPPAGLQSPTITIGGTEPTGNLTQNLLGMVTGDFDKSYSDATKSGGGSVTLLAGDTRYVEPGSDFELPVRAGMDMEVGALSLIFELPKDLFVVESVFLENNPTEPLLFNHVGNQLRTAWTSLSPLVLAEGKTLLTLKLKLLEPINQGFELALAKDPLIELADASCQPIADAQLVAEILTSSAVGIGNHTSGGLTLNNQPNPFKETTSFAYTIQQTGRVVLEVYDLLGNRVNKLVDEMQEAGSHNVALKDASLRPGVYIARLKLVSKDQDMMCAIRIIRR